MKKTILTIMVAAMMLVAFTACEQPVPGLSKAIIGADIVQTGTFLEGQPFDASKFSVNVTYSDKTTGKLEGANVVFQGGSGNVTGVKNGDVVTVSLPVSVPNYSGSTNVKTETVTFKTAIVAYTIDSITVSGPATVNSTDGKIAQPEISDLSAVASYRDSSDNVQTVDLVAADLKLYGSASFVDSTVSGVTADKPTALATQEVQVKWQSTAKGEFQYTVQYAGDDDPTPATEYAWYEGMVVYRQVPASSTVKYIQRGVFNADDMIELYKVYAPKGQAASTAITALTDYYLVPLEAAQGETLTVKLASTSQLNTQNPNRFKANTTDVTEETTATVDFSYTFIKDAVYGETDSTTAKIAGSIDVAPVTNDDGNLVLPEGKKIAAVAVITLNGIKPDYTTNLVVVWNGKGGVANTAYDKDNAFELGKDFTATATWASGYADDSVTKLTTGVTFDPEKAPSLKTADNAYELDVTYAAGKGNFTNCKYTTTVTVRVNADPANV